MTARNHHFVSQCYLRGFTHDQERQSKLTVLDRERRKHFSTSSRNIAVQRDFNRIDIEGHTLDALELGYAAFEDRLASALRHVEEMGNIDDENDRTYLLNFIALLATRNPRFRDKMDAVLKHTMRIIMDMVVSSKEMYESQIKGAQKSGHLREHQTVPYEDMKRLIDNDAFSIEIPREQHILRETELHQTVLECLAGRKWTILNAYGDTGFITSDHPVCLRWTANRFMGSIDAEITQLVVPYFFKFTGEIKGFEQKQQRKMIGIWSLEDCKREPINIKPTSPPSAKTLPQSPEGELMAI